MIRLLKTTQQMLKERQDMFDVNFFRVTISAPSICSDFILTKYLYKVLDHILNLQPLEYYYYAQLKKL